MATNDNQEGSFKEIKKELDSYGSPLEKIVISLDEMFKHADKINRAFVDGRVRIQEMDLAVANSAAGIIRLGGSLEDVSTTITQIAAGSRRNVIATEEQVSKLYASSKILNTDANVLVDSFAKVRSEERV
jgi:prepilin-type processing-associated H-X9-DG protein